MKEILGALGVLIGLGTMVWAWKTNTPPEEQQAEVGSTVGIALIGLIMIFISILFGFLI